tara:strand:+ start:419 stop:1240 length:822 start_codon:yes stop_codon:yes gene_type:complete
MKILIESRNNASVAVHNALVQGGVKSFLWDNSSASIIDAYDQVKPDIVIINNQCNPMQCKALIELESRVNFIFIGEWNEAFPAPILCLDQKVYQSFPSVPLPTSVFDTSSVLRGFFDPKTACEISVFTDGMTEEFINLHIDIINLLITKNARFFGSVGLPVPNYLGDVSTGLRSKIIASSDVCVDVLGSSWEVLALSGAVVLSKDSPIEEFSFKDAEELGSKIEGFLESRPNTSNLKILSMERSGIDICIDIFRFLKMQNLVEHFIKVRQSFL